MPKQGFKSITVKEEIYEALEDIYNQNKTRLEHEGIDSLSSFVTKIISAYIKQTSGARLEHFNLFENVIRIRDNKLGRIVDVDYRNEDMFCEQCESSNCVHTGYAWSVYEHYRKIGSPFT
ncbi:MAG: hypothetical protein QW767_00660 [Thermoprotei archaeon]